MFTNEYYPIGDEIGFDVDITKLRRKELLTHFECERRLWLDAGMSEAAIFLVHFGENGRGGDYAVWLAERKHTRNDHKYAPGIPVAIDMIDPDCAWISSGRNTMDEVEFKIDMEAALSTLTDLQRRSFCGVRLDGRTQKDVADELGISRDSVKQAIEGAIKKLMKISS